MHAAGEDMRICLLRTGAVPRRIFDVQIAAGLVGYSYPLSLVNLVAQVLKIRSPAVRRGPTGGATADSGAAPLRAGRRSAPSRPGRPSREQACPDGPFGLGGGGVCRFLDAVVNRADEERWRRLPGLHQLNRRGLEMVRRLAEWREDEARHQNRPLRQVMRDDLLVAIAKRQPTSRRDLEALRDFNRPGLLQKCQAILAVLEQARSAPADSHPELSPRPDDSPGASTIANLLSAAMAQLCARREVAASARGQRVGPETPDSLVSRWPARSRSPRAPLGLAGRALRRALARGSRRPEDVSRGRPRQRDPHRAGAGPARFFTILRGNLNRWR